MRVMYMNCCYSVDSVVEEEEEDDCPFLYEEQLSILYESNSKRLSVNVDRYLYLKRLSKNDIALLFYLHGKGYDMYSKTTEDLIRKMKKVKNQ